MKNTLTLAGCTGALALLSLCNRGFGERLGQRHLLT